MAKLKDDRKSSPPARSPRTREKQLTKLAMDLAEEQLRKGTATSQVITHFLKLGTEQEALNREKTKHEIKLIKSKAEAIESGKELKKLYADALRALATYSGDDSDLPLNGEDYEPNS